LKYHRAGKPGMDKVNNLGIVMLNALRYNPGDPKAMNLDVARLQVLVRVQNFRNEPAQAKLRLDVLKNGKRVQHEEPVLQIEKRKLVKGDPEAQTEDKDEPGEAGVSFLLPAFDLRDNLVLHAYLENPNDDFPGDDEAWLAIGAVR